MATFEEARERKGWSRKEAIEVMEIGRSSLHTYETKNRIPKDEILWKMYNAYDLTEEELGAIILNKLKGKFNSMEHVRKKVSKESTKKLSNEIKH